MPPFSEQKKAQASSYKLIDAHSLDWMMPTNKDSPAYKPFQTGIMSGLDNTALVVEEESVSDLAFLFDSSQTFSLQSGRKRVIAACLQVSFPSIPEIEGVVYKRFPVLQVVKSVELFVGGEVLQSFPKAYLRAWFSLHAPKAESLLGKEGLAPGVCFLPLPFFFQQMEACLLSSPNQAIDVQGGDIDIRITYEAEAELLHGVAQSNFSLHNRLHPKLLCTYLPMTERETIATQRHKFVLAPIEKILKPQTSIVRHTIKEALGEVLVIVRQVGLMDPWAPPDTSSLLSHIRLTIAGAIIHDHEAEAFLSLKPMQRYRHLPHDMLLYCLPIALHPSIPMPSGALSTSNLSDTATLHVTRNLGAAESIVHVIFVEHSVLNVRAT